MFGTALHFHRNNQDARVVAALGQGSAATPPIGGVLVAAQMVRSSPCGPHQESHTDSCLRIGGQKWLLAAWKSPLRGRHFEDIDAEDGHGEVMPRPSHFAARRVMYNGF
jgi:hypothetical protein